jgi:hypothetical protein
LDGPAPTGLRASDSGALQFSGDKRKPKLAPHSLSRTRSVAPAQYRPVVSGPAQETAGRPRQPSHRSNLEAAVVQGKQTGAEGAPTTAFVAPGPEAVAAALTPAMSGNVPISTPV